MNRGQSQNPSDSGAGIIIMVSIGAGATFIAAREEFSHFRSTPFCSRGFIQPRDKSCTVFRSVISTSVNPFGSRDFSVSVFCQWLFVCARTWICCKTLAKLKFSVNAWDRSANFLYQNRASRSNNDISAYCLALYPLKQVLIFRFMPSQFATH